MGDVAWALKQVRNNLHKSGIDASTIEAALQLQGESTRMAVNRSLHFTVESSAIGSSQLELNLIECPPKSKRPSENGSKREDERVVGQHSIKLTDLSIAPNATLPGPITFATSFGEVEAQIHISLTAIRQSVVADLSGSSSDDLKMEVHPDYSDSLPATLVSMLSRTGKHSMASGSNAKKMYL